MARPKDINTLDLSKVTNKKDLEGYSVDEVVVCILDRIKDLEKQLNNVSKQ